MNNRTALAKTPDRPTPSRSMWLSPLFLALPLKMRFCCWCWCCWWYDSITEQNRISLSSWKGGNIFHFKLYLLLRKTTEEKKMKYCAIVIMICFCWHQLPPPSTMSSHATRVMPCLSWQSRLKAKRVEYTKAYWPAPFFANFPKRDKTFSPKLKENLLPDHVNVVGILKDVSGLFLHSLFDSFFLNLKKREQMQCFASQNKKNTQGLSKRSGITVLVGGGGFSFEWSASHLK